MRIALCLILSAVGVLGGAAYLAPQLTPAGLATDGPAASAPLGDVATAAFKPEAPAGHVSTVLSTFDPEISEAFFASDAARAPSLATGRDALEALEPPPRVAVPQRAPVGGDHGFRFVRIRYDSHPGLRSNAWATDYPEAEQNLHEAISRTTGIHLDGQPVVLNLTDDRIFEYPVLYITEPGYWMTNEEEVASLKRYLDRGGFLIIDDFHDYGRGSVGPEWNNMYQNVKRVYPDREPVELTKEHPIWSIYYDIDPDAAVSTKNNFGWQRFDPMDDIYYGIFDENGRMAIVICYNQDIGDGWEWPNRNLADASTVSFQMAINFIIYAFTH